MAEVFDAYYKWLGIPPEEQPPSHYRLLALRDFEGDAEVIQAASDRQMGFVRAHQTGPHSAWSQKLLNEIAAARVCLLNAGKKAEYDAQLRAVRAAQAVLAAPSAARPAKPPRPAKAARPAPRSARALGQAMAAAGAPGPVVDSALPVPRRRWPLAEALAAVAALIVGAAAVAVVLDPFDMLRGRPAERPQPGSPVAAVVEDTDADVPATGSAVANPASPAQTGNEPAGGPAGPVEEEGVGAVPGNEPEAAPEPFIIRGLAPPEPVHTAPPAPPASEAKTAGSVDSVGNPASAAAPLTLAELVEKVERSVTVVETDKGACTGLIVGGSGTVVTSASAVAGAQRLQVTVHGRPAVDAEVASVSPACDLILLRIETPTFLSPVELSEEPPSPSSQLVAVGFSDSRTLIAERRRAVAMRRGREVAALLGGPPSVETRVMIDLVRDPSPRWIEISEPLPSGCRGGALLDGQGKLVGLIIGLTAGRKDTALAVASGDIRDLLDDAPSPLARPSIRRPGLPPLPGGTTPARTPVITPTKYIRLPSGKTISFAWFDPHSSRSLDPGTFAALRDAAGDAKSLSLTSTEGKSMGRASHLIGVLEGTAVLDHENGKVRIRGAYHEGGRHGPLLALDAEGRPTFWCVYNNGRRDGLCCYFEEGKLRLVLECSRGSVDAMHLVADDAVVKSAGGESADPEFVALLAALDQAEAGSFAAERDLKELVREADKAERQKLASELNLKKRAAIQSRINQHRAEQDQLIQGLKRRTGM